ncbi:MAG: DUF4388 domain-containing protein [Nannocystaceae bacterium]
MDASAETREPAEFGRGIVGSGIRVELLDYVQLVALGGRDRMIEVVTPQGSCRIWFDTGDIIHAVFGEVEGELAFFRLLRVGAGTFTETTVDNMPTPTIMRSSTSLLLEAARVDDESRTAATVQRPATSKAALQSEDSGKIELFTEFEDSSIPAPTPPLHEPQPDASPSSPRTVEAEGYGMMLEQFWQYEGVTGAALVANTGDVLANDLRGADHLLTVAGFYVRGAARLARTLGLGVSEAICACEPHGAQAMVLQLGNAYVLLALGPDADPRSLQRTILDPQLHPQVATT